MTYFHTLTREGYRTDPMTEELRRLRGRPPARRRPRRPKVRRPRAARPRPAPPPPRRPKASTRPPLPKNPTGKRPRRGPVPPPRAARPRPARPPRATRPPRRPRPLPWRPRPLPKRPGFWLRPRRRPLPYRSYERQIRRNLRLARSLGWRRHLARIRSTLRLASGAPIDRWFVRAVERWQRDEGLRVTGVIGTITWRRLRRRIGVTPPRSPAPLPAREFFKDDPALRRWPLSPARSLPARQGPAGPLVTTYNRLGKLLREMAARVNLDPATVLAVWQAESEGERHQTDRTPLRFDTYRFYRDWGRTNEAKYRKHFRYGGYAGSRGPAWQGQQFRRNPTGSFRPLRETALHYDAYRKAKALAGPKTALRAVRLGEPRIAVRRYASLGYASPEALYRAFQASLRDQFLGFFDLCMQYPAPEAGDLLVYLREGRWAAFVKAYYPDRDLKAATRRLQDTHRLAQSVVADT